MALGAFAGALMVVSAGHGPLYDGVAYWAVDPADPYARAAGTVQAARAFWYAPPLAFAFAPFGLMPLHAFWLAWTAFLVGVLRVIGGRQWWVLLGIPFVVVELYAGNVHLLMAAAVVLGFRWPAAWALLALTKVTPFVGVLWFAFRREWRSFGIALGATAAIAAVGYVLTPGLWHDWVAALASAAALPQPGLGGPLWLRLPVALLLLAWAAPRDARWCLPIVVLLALPNIWGGSLAILAASVALSAPRRESMS